MKIIWFLFIFDSLMFAGQTELVFGNFSSSYNAKMSVNKINKKINKNPKFKKFFKANSLITTYTKDGKYFSVVIKPFNNSTIKNRVYAFFQSQYKDAYVLRLSSKKKVAKKKNVHKKKLLEPSTISAKKDNEFPYIKPDSVQYFNK